MGREIERKYLVDSTKWQKLEKPKGQLYRQGYLLTDPNKTIRVRQAEGKGYLTIKGLTVGASRPEYEYEIPVGEAGELLENFSVAELSKLRYKIAGDGKVWEVDAFLGDNEGLVIAEIELASENEGFSIPEWIGEEVTGQVKYYNSSLTAKPYKKWE